LIDRGTAAGCGILEEEKEILRKAAVRQGDALDPVAGFEFIEAKPYSPVKRNSDCQGPSE
jgi:hypothetical protein